jgi:ABC-2 type transport system permease protein
MTIRDVPVRPGRGRTGEERFRIARAIPRPAWSRLARTETRLFLREPMALFWGLVFPLVLLIVMGVASDGPKKDLGGLRLVDVYTPILIGFVIAVLAVNAVPPVLAGYRERGVLRRLSTTPVPPAALLAVELMINFAVVLAGMVAILAVARLAFDVPLPGQPAGFLVAVVLAALALLAIGLFVAAVAPSGRMGNAIGAIVFFPMMFFAGLWIPRPLMGDGLRAASDYTPLGAAVRALGDATAGSWPPATSLLVMAGYAVLFGYAALRFFLCY